MDLRSRFKTPPAEYAPLAFWFWNEDLKERELIAQARDMFAKGVHGFFMHARSGLVRPRYLSSGWMRLVERVVEEARRLGAKAWLYDEMGWRSGSAGGKVPRLGERYQQKFIECIPVRVSGRSIRVAPGREVVAIFHSREYPLRSRPAPANISSRLRAHNRVDLSGLGGGWLLVFAIGRQPSYIDTLARQPVAAFIRFTHEAYRKRIGPHFGKTVPGAFTDEPSHRAYDLRTPVLKAPWTDRLPLWFEVRFGYSPIQHLPSLFFDVGDFERLRHDFWQSVSELFASNYGETIYDWCEQNRLAFTGHYEYEVPLHMQIQCLSAAMPLYRNMHVPGLDLLGRNRPRYERQESIVLAKQPASVANQFGRTRVLCEAFGTGGWDFGPERAKWQADWLFALGVNMLCIHGMYYSIAGRRKFDAPPDFLRQPWWEIGKPLYDHCARVSYVLSQGRPRRDVLVLHPVRAAWARHRPQDHSGTCDPEDSRMGKAFGALLEALVESHIDFDLVDEGLLAEGRARGAVLELGRARYGAVIVPPLMHVLERSTSALLNALAKQGGMVISLSRPKRLHGESGREPVLGAHVKVLRTPGATSAIGEAVRLAARAIGSRTRIVGTGADAVAMHERELGAGRRAIFLSNSSLDEVRVRAQVPGRWRVEEWDTASGRAREVRCEKRGGATSVRLDFAPAGSRLLMLSRANEVRSQAGGLLRKTVLLALNGWRVQPKAPNLLTFDYCRARGRGSTRWSAPMPVFKARQRGGVSAIRFEFLNRAEARDRENVLFAYEGAGNTGVRINGRSLRPGKAALPRYLDFCQAVDISQALVGGLNVIELRCLAGHTAVEKAYLLGNFGVRQVSHQMFAIEPPVPAVGAWCDCGFPFFPGPMEYSCEFSLRRLPGGRVFLEVESLREAASVFVNGRKAGDMLWRPWRTEVTGLLRPGANRVRLLVYGTLRNAFGPWHFPGDEGCAGFSYEHWTDSKGWTDEYLFVPLGLLGPVRLSVMSGA